MKDTATQLCCSTLSPEPSLWFNDLGKQDKFLRASIIICNKTSS